MIITKTPFRISFVGGGSDFEDFYSQHPGAVLSATIDKFMYIASHHFFDTAKIRVKYSQTETVTDIKKLRHPIVREVLKKFHIKGALEISSNGDVPAGTGLGSSSAFTVGLLHNLYVRAGRYVTKKKLASEACDIEINRLNEPIGRQDQYAAAFGGLNVIKFNTSGEVDVEPIHLKKEIYKKLQDALVMFYTGRVRNSSRILSRQKKNLKSKNKTDILRQMAALAWKLRLCLYSGNLDDFGEILHENWMLKTHLAPGISCPEIDSIYKKAMASGATGGKLLGAGGSGFMLFYCAKEKQEKLRRALSPLREMSFKFDNEGTKLVYVEDEYLEH